MKLENLVKTMCLLFAGKLVEEQQHQKRMSDHSDNNSDSGNGEAGEPPTPPHTPQREVVTTRGGDRITPEGEASFAAAAAAAAAAAGRPMPFQHLDPLQQQALHARVSKLCFPLC